MMAGYTESVVDQYNEGSSSVIIGDNVIMKTVDNRILIEKCFEGCLWLEKCIPENIFAFGRSEPIKNITNALYISVQIQMVYLI